MPDDHTPEPADAAEIIVGSVVGTPAEGMLLSRPDGATAYILARDGVIEIPATIHWEPRGNTAFRLTRAGVERVASAFGPVIRTLHYPALSDGCQINSRDAHDMIVAAISTPQLGIGQGETFIVTSPEHGDLPTRVYVRRYDRHGWRVSIELDSDDHAVYRGPNGAARHVLSVARGLIASA